MALTIYLYLGFCFGIEIYEEENITHLLISLGFLRIQLSTYNKE